MSMEETIRQIIREENERHLQDIKKLLESHGYQEHYRLKKRQKSLDLVLLRFMTWSIVATKLDFRLSE